VVHITLVLTVAMAPFLSRMGSWKSLDALREKIQIWAYQLMGFYFVFFFLLLLKIPLVLFIAPKLMHTILSLSALGFSIALTLKGYLVTRRSPSLIHVKVKIENLPSDLENFKIIQFSDVHVSHSIKKDFVENIVAISNNHAPDIVAFTGDIIDGKVSDLKDELHPFLNLKTKYGVFYCPGNHEYYWGIDSWLNEFKKMSFNVLTNAHEEIKIGKSVLTIGGVHDLSSHRVDSRYQCDPAAAFLGSDINSIKILLAHQPKTMSLIQDEKISLVLSGHTHAGQFFPATFFISFFQPYVKGLHLIKKTWLYVNQGTGYWGPPNRLGTKSEVTLIELVSK
jgi:predicted MPP superfamily phosphohydrolase